jgi:hypothetical protein
MAHFETEIEPMELEGAMKPAADADADTALEEAEMACRVYLESAPQVSPFF